MNKEPATVYCYHCRTSHSRADMRLVESKTGKRWRCIQSIKAAKSSKDQREAFGRQVSEINKENLRMQQRLSKVKV